MKDILLEQVERHFAAAAVSEARDRVHDLLVEDGVMHHPHVAAASAVAAALEVKLQALALARVSLFVLALAAVVRVGIHLDVPKNLMERAE